MVASVGVDRKAVAESVSKGAAYFKRLVKRVVFATIALLIAIVGLLVYLSQDQTNEITRLAALEKQVMDSANAGRYDAALVLAEQLLPTPSAFTNPQEFERYRDEFSRKREFLKNTILQLQAKFQADSMEAAAGFAESVDSIVPTEQPITGTLHTVNMLGDGEGYRFEPAEITVSAGDVVKFVMVNGGPHNVAFDPAMLSAEAKAALSANMPRRAGELSGEMLLNSSEEYSVSFANVPAGTYEYFCTPHLAMNMKGKIIVR